MTHRKSLALSMVCGLALLTACQQNAAPTQAPNHSPTGPQADAAGPATAGSQAASPDGHDEPPVPPGVTAAPANGGADRAAMERGPGDRAPSETGVPVTTATRPSNPVLAFDYRFTLALPSAQVRPLMETHQEACERAGPDQCQVMGVESHEDEADKATATLTLRATPAWSRLFRGRLEGDAHDAHGRILSGSTEGVDVAPVLQRDADADNALTAREAEIQRAIAQGDDSDELREELAQVRIQIQQARAQRADTQQRVAMSTMVIDYRADSLVPSSGVTAPLAESLRQFWGVSAQVAAVIVDIAAVLAPFVIIGVPLWWFVARARRRAAAEKARSDTTATAASPPPSGAGQTQPPGV